MDDTTYMQYVEQARQMGAEAGACAASWVDMSDPGDARAILDGLRDCDPAILDSLPYPDLSGQWAGDPTPRSVWMDIAGEEPQTEEEEDCANDCADAWMECACGTFATEVERIATACVAWADACGAY